MVWGITVYFIASVIISVSAFFNAGWFAGVSTFLTSLFAFVIGSRLKALVYWEDWRAGRSQDMAIAGVLVSVVLIALAYWFATKFSVTVGGHYLSGTMWGCIGVVVCFLCTDKKMAGMKATP